MLAAQALNVRIVQSLLSSSPDPKTVNIEHKSALDLAREQGCATIHNAMQ